MEIDKKTLAIKYCPEVLWHLQAWAAYHVGEHFLGFNHKAKNYPHYLLWRKFTLQNQEILSD